MSSPSALVTGASRGIGLGIATRLAERGYALTVAARDPERLDAVAEELRAAGAPDVQAVAGDIADEDYLADSRRGARCRASRRSTRWSSTPASARPVRWRTSTLAASTSRSR